ncbi:large subunit ribosomal protein L24 [Flexibacter flexilis DSM 6793]|uniref:Large ribosomal subunit protein uL24 n=1 Tax=Flexibacter flexilis DSM 6793 TaxID=927664 RepID=A0A1I1MSB4_9BACT|nr:50S ribosomal protein L24 [Flexibacter flexilis]SFC88261.1 large subunit ribosomal protein L24 [Flexibacter flexilis DSM 6793]
MKAQPKKIKLRIKVGDEVTVIAGDSKGKTGTVLSVDAVKNRAIVKDVNLVTKHIKPTAATANAAAQQGDIVKKEASIHISNLALIDPKSGKATRVGRKLDEKGKLQRFSKKTGDIIK